MYLPIEVEAVVTEEMSVLLGRITSVGECGEGGKEVEDETSENR